MVKIKLKTMMRAYGAGRQIRMTYRLLSERSGVSVAALQSIGSRTNYYPSLATLEKICSALDCDIGDLVEFDIGRHGAPTSIDDDMATHSVANVGM